MREKIIEYYINVKKLNKLKNRYKNIEKKVEEVSNSLCGSDIILKNDIAAQQYSDEIQGTGGKISSSVDREIEKIYKQRERYLASIEKEKAYIYNNILELELKVSAIENALLDLEECEIKLLEARFKNHKTVRVIAHEMFCGAESTTYSKIKEILTKIKIDKNLEEFKSKTVVF